LDRETKEAKESSVAMTTSLQKRVMELENLLAVEQNRNQQLQLEKENEAKTSQAALDMLRLDLEKVASAKEDLSVQLRNKNTKLAEVKNKAGRLNGALERYRTEHIQCAKVLCSEVLELLGQCNLDAPPTLFPQCTVGSFYEWVSACFDLITMNTKIFGELGAEVGARTLAYSVYSLVPADCPLSKKLSAKVISGT
jgi:hypothetical protein